MLPRVSPCWFSPFGSHQISFVTRIIQNITLLAYQHFGYYATSHKRIKNMPRKISKNSIKTVFGELISFPSKEEKTDDDKMYTLTTYRLSNLTWIYMVKVLLINRNLTILWHVTSKWPLFCIMVAIFRERGYILIYTYMYNVILPKCIMSRLSIYNNINTHIISNGTHLREKRDEVMVFSNSMHRKESVCIFSLCLLQIKPCMEVKWVLHTVICWWVIHSCTTHSGMYQFQKLLVFIYVLNCIYNFVMVLWRRLVCLSVNQSYVCSRKTFRGFVKHFINQWEIRNEIVIANTTYCQPNGLLMQL